MVTSKNFSSTEDFLDFSVDALNYVENNTQRLIARNEKNYNFFVYDDSDGGNITRPFNTNLIYSSDQYPKKVAEFKQEIQIIRTNKGLHTNKERELVNRVIYTTQQCIGFILDSIGENQSKKVNGDLFEQFILTFINDIGVKCRSLTHSVPVIIDGEEQFTMQYQHDMVIEDESNNEKLIGSIKTTSKDRIDKIFIDRFLYCNLTDHEVPHIAIFLHDVQRGKLIRGQYNVSTTFLIGHFKGYTVKLCKLDGVYYLDRRPNMLSDDFLKAHIKPFDALISDDIWKFL
ncbi:hypothetical protein [Methanosarcina sp. UBA5]|uniref:hypothetical protein n=1 Tax=Methanosarcina sp. UBA5 TaxID=1915593 RepID=UPI0025E9D7C6|nr:hypothetical protein [Methanosarcina sp. UBA5]